MAVFIEVTTDAFQDTFNKKVAVGESRRRAGLDRARRPLRGLEIKNDTYALIKVIQADGTSLPLFDQSSPDGTDLHTSSFILQTVQEARMEKHQIVETFGESYIYFFGEAPRFLDVQAILINSNDFNWEAEWWANYNAYFRGTRSVELGARTYLFYDDTIVEGYMLQASSAKMSDAPLQVSLTFRLFLTNYQNISFVGSPDFPTRSTVQLPASVSSLSDALNGEQINDLVGSTSGKDSNGSALGGFDLVRNAPLRGQIVDNLDEWTGATPSTAPDLFGALRQQVEDDIQEAQDLLLESIDRLAAFGANVNDPAFMIAMGFGPSFSSLDGFGIGAGAGFSAGATFSATASFSVDGSVGVGVGAGASASLAGFFGSSSPDDLEAQQLAEVEFLALVESQAQLALDQNGGSATFLSGASASAGFSVSASASASFGTSASASASASASVSAGASYAGAGAGAAVSVGGSASAFAMASFQGTVDPTGSATATASASVGVF